MNLKIIQVCTIARLRKNHPTIFFVVEGVVKLEDFVKCSNSNFVNVPRISLLKKLAIALVKRKLFQKTHSLNTFIAAFSDDLRRVNYIK